MREYPSLNATDMLELIVQLRNGKLTLSMQMFRYFILFLERHFIEIYFTIQFLYACTLEFFYSSLLISTCVIVFIVIVLHSSSFHLSKFTNPKTHEKRKTNKKNNWISVTLTIQLIM